MIEPKHLAFLAEVRALQSSLENLTRRLRDEAIASAGTLDARTFTALYSAKLAFNAHAANVEHWLGPCKTEGHLWEHGKCLKCDEPMKFCPPAKPEVRR